MTPQDDQLAGGIARIESGHDRQAMRAASTCVIPISVRSVMGTMSVQTAEEDTDGLCKTSEELQILYIKHVRGVSA